jgi:hypothetical protein
MSHQSCHSDSWKQLDGYSIVRKCRHEKGGTCVIAGKMSASDAESLQSRLRDAGVETEVVAAGAAPTWQ